MNISIYLLIIIAINVICSLKGFKDRSFFETYKFNVGGIIIISIKMNPIIQQLAPVVP